MVAFSLLNLVGVWGFFIGFGGGHFMKWGIIVVWTYYHLFYLCLCFNLGYLCFNLDYLCFNFSVCVSIFFASYYPPTFVFQSNTVVFQSSYFVFQYLILCITTYHSHFHSPYITPNKKTSTQTQCQFQYVNFPTCAVVIPSISRNLSNSFTGPVTTAP